MTFTLRRPSGRVVLKADNLPDLIAETERLLRTAFGNGAYPKKLFDDVVAIVAPAASRAHQESLATSNIGIVHYWANQTDQDAILFADSFRFY